MDDGSSVAGLTAVPALGGFRNALEGACRGESLSTSKPMPSGAAMNQSAQPTLPIRQIVPGKNPREYFDPQKMAELEEGIRVMTHRILHRSRG